MKKYTLSALAMLILSVSAACTGQTGDSSENSVVSETAQAAETQSLSDIHEGATITFDDGSLWTAECIGDYNFEDDEAECSLSVEEFNGSNQLRIEILTKNSENEYKVPKIRFDVDKLVGINNVSKIKSVSLDITAAANGTFTADDGSELFVPGNCIGEIDANSGEGCKVWATLASFSFDEWTEPYITKHIEGNINLPKARYFDGESGCTLVFMRWSIPNKADVYIDNITFYDDDGNPVPLVYDPYTDTDETDITDSETTGETGEISVVQ